MSNSHLKLYSGPADTQAPAVSKSESGQNCVTLNAGDILPLLADAVNSRRTWLSDFEDDEITISTDLYEVLLAYQYFRRPSA
jgi:hypothetical protein